MCKWGLSPFAHAKESDDCKKKHVQKGTVPICTFLFQNPNPPIPPIPPEPKVTVAEC